MDLRGGKKVGSGEEIGSGEEVEIMESVEQIGSVKEDSRQPIGEKDDPMRVMMEMFRNMNENMMRMNENMNENMMTKRDKKEMYENINENISRELGKLRKDMESTDSKVEKTRVEFRQEINKLKGNKDSRLEQTKRDVREEMIGRIEEVELVQEEKIKKAVEKEVNVEMRQVKNGIKLVEGKIKDLEKDRAVGTVNVISGVRLENKFNGDIEKIHPKVFMKMLKHKLRGIESIEDLKESIRESVENDVLLWFSSREGQINSLEEFERLFLGYYWGEFIQASVRERLYSGKFSERDGIRSSQYALKLYSMAQYLEPAMREEEIIRYISRHFQYKVTETITLQNIKTMDLLNNYLLRVEQDLGRGMFVNEWRGERNERKNGGYNVFFEQNRSGERYSNGRYDNRNYRQDNNYNRNRDGNNREFNNYNRNRDGNSREFNSYNRNRYEDDRQSNSYNRNIVSSRDRNSTERIGSREIQNRKENYKREDQVRRMNYLRVDEIENREGEGIEEESRRREENFVESTYQN